jgi:hypothetical protein
MRIRNTGFMQAAVWVSFAEPHPVFMRIRILSLQFVFCFYLTERILFFYLYMGQIKLPK